MKKSGKTFSTVFLFPGKTDSFFYLISVLQAFGSILLINTINQKSYQISTPSEFLFKAKDTNRVAMVIPAHNEEKLIQRTLSNIPEAIDKIYVVNDASRDRTIKKVKEMIGNVKQSEKPILPESLEKRKNEVLEEIKKDVGILYKEE